MIPHIRLTVIDSTNAFLKRALRENSEMTVPVYVTADSQTNGRGRLGRSFLSPEGGLYMSVAVKPALPLALVTPLAGVAVCEAVEEMCGTPLLIKWVNDLFLNGKKVCGILAEAAEDKVVIGIGLNLKTPENGFPGVPVAGSLDTDVPACALAERIAEKVVRGCAEADAEAVLAGYRARLMLTGLTVRYTLNGRAAEGRVLGVDGLCGLIVETEGGTRVLRSGEVSIGSGSFFGG